MKLEVMSRKLGLLAPLGVLLGNLAIAFVLYSLARIIYLLVNYSYFEQGLTFSHLMEMLGGGVVFDTSAILVTNIPYIVLMLLPWHRKENKSYKQVCKWVFIIINGLALAINLCDAVYFRYMINPTLSNLNSDTNQKLTIPNLNNIYEVGDEGCENIDVLRESMGIGTIQGNNGNDAGNQNNQNNSVNLSEEVMQGTVGNGMAEGDGAGVPNSDITKSDEYELIESKTFPYWIVVAVCSLAYGIFHFSRKK